MSSARIHDFQRPEFVKAFGGSIILTLFALLLLAILLLVTIRVDRVSGTEVGVKVNNLTGKITVVTQQGTQIYNGFLTSFYILDKTVQRLEMTASPDRGDRRGKDDIRIKTIDGSDVYVDITINYRMLPERVEEIVLTSGLDNTYKVKWVRDYARSICRAVLGELTTEQFYDASERDGKALKAKDELNKELNQYGIEILSVIAEKFRFHEEYEQKIREKKLADQEVEEQISKANAARQNQVFRIVEATKQMEVAIESYKGEMEKITVEAKAGAEKNVKDAQAYSIAKLREGDGVFYQKEQNAKAILAVKKAEAEGTSKMVEAMAGEGGVNLVKIEYAKRLEGMKITGQPFVMEGRTERFNVIEDRPAVLRRPAPTPAPAP
jgi:regulator of protease activity HflC (stomatin/prohibitin superfamily)